MEGFIRGGFQGRSKEGVPAGPGGGGGGKENASQPEAQANLEGWWQLESA